MKLQEQIHAGILQHNVWLSGGKTHLAKITLQLLRDYNVRLTVGVGGMLSIAGQPRLVE